MGWLIAIGILALLAVMPVGLRLSYDADGFVICLKPGLIFIKLYPRKKKAEKPQKAVTKQKSAKKAKPAQKEDKQGGKWTDFLPLVKTGLAFLGQLRRKLRVKLLAFHIVMASDDPADLAVNYGRAWASAGNVIPLLEQAFVIRKKDIQLQCDFTADTVLITAVLDISITLGRLLALTVKYGVKALREYFKIMNLRKGGADS